MTAGTEPRPATLPYKSHSGCFIDPFLPSTDNLFSLQVPSASHNLFYAPAGTGWRYLLYAEEYGLIPAAAAMSLSPPLAYCVPDARRPNLGSVLVRTLVCQTAVLKGW